jgi:hypothetical protein
VALMLSLRVALGFIGWQSLRLWPIGRPQGEWTDLLLPARDPQFAFVGLWQRWDALWYEHIAISGYRYGNFDIMFFPLYPGLMHALGALLGGAYALAGLIVSSLAFVMALVLLYHLVERDFDTATASRAVLYVALAPFAFFYLAPLTEAPFLALSLAAFLAARTGRFGIASVAATLATLCRLQGIILLLPIALEMWRDLRDRHRSGLALFRPVYLASLLPPLALACFYVYGTVTIGVPGGFVEAGVAHWGHRVVGIWTALSDSLRVVQLGRRPEEVFNLASVVLMLIALPFMFARLPLSYSVFAAGMLVPVAFQEAAATPLLSAARYLTVVFPLFVLLALWGRRDWLDRAILAASPVMMGALFVYVVHFGWLA